MKPDDLTLRRRFTLGIICLFLVIATSIGSSEILQHVYKGQNFQKPFFITYLNGCCFLIYNFGFFFIKQWRDIWNDGFKIKDEEKQSLLDGMAKLSLKDAFNQRKLIIISAIKFTFLWIFATYFYNFSLGYTLISVNRILSASSALFTYILFNVFVKRDSSFYLFLNVGFCILNVGGIALVSLVSEQNAPTSQKESYLVAYVFCVLSALFYSFYLVMITKSFKGREQYYSPPMFLGIVGFFVVFLLWPMFLLLHFTKVEPFEFPSDFATWGYLVINALIGTVVNDCLWLFSAYLTTPVITTIGLSMMMPTSLVIDYFFAHTNFNGLFFLGSALVFISFIGLNVTTYKQERQSEEDAHRVIEISETESDTGCCDTQTFIDPINTSDCCNKKE